MRAFLSGVVVVLVLSLATVSAAQTWGPACATSTTEGVMRWHGPEPQIFDAGLSGCFEENGRCSPDAQSLRLSNVSSATIWVRIMSSGDVLRIGPGARMLLSLNNTGGVVRLAVRNCSGTGYSNRRLSLGAAQYGVLTYGGSMRFDVPVTQEGTVHISLTSESFDTYLRLYRGDHLVAVNDDASGTLNSELFVFLTEGLYTIEVSSFNNGGGGGYILQTEEAR